MDGGEEKSGVLKRNSKVAGNVHTVGKIFSWSVF